MVFQSVAVYATGQWVMLLNKGNSMHKLFNSCIHLVLRCVNHGVCKASSALRSFSAVDVFLPCTTKAYQSLLSVLVSSSIVAPQIIRRPCAPVFLVSARVRKAKRSNLRQEPALPCSSFLCFFRYHGEKPAQHPVRLPKAFAGYE